MKLKLMLCAFSFSLAATMASATPVLTVGVPGDALLSSPSKPSPLLGGKLINFDSLTPFATYSTYTSGSVNITSPDGLVVYPYSTQSGPNELFDNSAEGSANITISFGGPTAGVGIGIADSDSVNVILQALGSNGLALGSPFSENLATTESAINTGNGYYVITDTTADIYGLEILQPLSNVNYSGLAIDDLQIAATPEPASFVFLAEGICALGVFARLRGLKRA